MMLLNRILLLAILFLKVFTLVDILNFVNTNALPLVNVTTSYLTDNGQTAFISLQSGGAHIINHYSIDIVSGTPTYVNKFVDPNNQVIANRLLTINGYLAAYSTLNLVFNVFGLNSYSFFGNYTINEYVE